MSGRSSDEIWLEVTYPHSEQLRKIVERVPTKPAVVLEVSKSRKRAFWSLQDHGSHSPSELESVVREWGALAKCKVERVSIRGDFRPRGGITVYTARRADYPAPIPVEQFLARMRSSLPPQVPDRVEANEREAEVHALVNAKGCGDSVKRSRAKDRDHRVFVCWLKRCTEEAVGQSVQSSIVYEHYKEAARGERAAPMGTKTFKNVMEGEGYPWQHFRLHNRFLGLRMR